MTLTELLKNAKHAVVLTGAGISTLSGIPDFRGVGGLYQRKVALYESTLGFIGVAAGSALALNLPQTALQIVMLCITVYTGVSMLKKK